MPKRRTWSHHELIPRVTQTVSVDKYDQATIEQELQRLRAQQSAMGGGPLAEAANAWTGAKDKMELVQDKIRSVGERLAQVWTSEASQECQYALMLIHDSAGDLGNTAHQISDFTGTSADLLRTMLANGPTGDDAGPAASFAGDVGAAYGQYSPLRAIPGVDSSTLADAGRRMYEAPGGIVDSIGGALGFGNDRTDEYRAALDTLNQQYVAESWRMPSSVSAKLPQIGGPSLDDIGTDDSIGGHSAPGAEIGSGNSLAERPVSPPMGDPAGGAAPPQGLPGSATGDSAQPTGTDHGTGGLAGTGGGVPPSGASTVGTGLGGGVGPATPGGAGGAGGGPGGYGIGGIGPGAAAVRPGATLPTRGSGSGSGGNRATGGGTGVRTGGAPGGAGSTNPGRTATGRPGMAGGMVPAGGTGAGDQGQPDRKTWLVEDDNPFRPEDEEDLPPGIVK